MTSSRKHFGKMQKGVEVAGVLFFCSKAVKQVSVI